MNQSYIVLGRLLDNKYRLIHHVSYVGLIFSFWFLFSINQLKSSVDILKVVLYSSTYIVIAYLNIYYLFKWYLLKGRIGLYVLITLVTFIISYITQNFIYFKTWEKFEEDLTPSIPLLADMLINAITYFMFIGIGLSVRMIKMWMSSEKKIISLEQENLKANLNNLKSQVSPHFLFNTFNNLYVLTKTKPLVAAEMILGFSDLMRYQLNECDREKVSLEKEINYIENYLALEKLRKDQLDVILSYNKSDLSGIMIEPLLFISLIENAVKHGSQQMENPFIHIHMTKVEKIFSFVIINSKPEVSLLGREKSLGKGIDNLKKRLNLSYPQTHHLELSNQQNRFSVKLKIELK